MYLAAGTGTRRKSQDDDQARLLERFWLLYHIATSATFLNLSLREYGRHCQRPIHHLLDNFGASEPKLRRTAGQTLRAQNQVGRVGLRIFLSVRTLDAEHSHQD